LSLLTSSRKSGYGGKMQTIIGFASALMEVKRIELHPFSYQSPNK